MLSSKNETFSLTVQSNKEDQKRKKAQEKKTPGFPKSNPQNPDCTCHTGKCQCQDD